MKPPWRKSWTCCSEWSGVARATFHAPAPSSYASLRTVRRISRLWINLRRFCRPIPALSSPLEEEGKARGYKGVNRCLSPLAALQQELRVNAGTPEKFRLTPFS
jgi:hypothetical protein